MQRTFLLSIALSTTLISSLVVLSLFPFETNPLNDSIHLRDIVEVTGRHADGTVFYHEVTHNLVTNKGRDWIAAQVGSGSGIANGTRYIALSNDGTAPANGDTSCPSEINANGLSRAQATYAHSAGTTTWTETKTFTAIGTQSIQKGCLLTNPTAGSTADYLFAETTFASASLVNGDTLTITWTVTMS